MKLLVSIVLALFLITIGTSTEASGNEDEYTIAAFTADVQKEIMVLTTTEIQDRIVSVKKRIPGTEAALLELNKDFASSGFNSLLGVSSLTEAEAKCGQNQTTSQSGGVSNADVLRSICALIASLSKQSYALNQSKERLLAELTVLENELPKRIEAEAKAKLEAEAKAAKKAKKKVIILCKKNKSTKKVSGTNPKCPKGFKQI